MRVTSFLLALTLACAPAVTHALTADRTLDLGDGRAVVYALPEGWQTAPTRDSVETFLPGTTVRFAPKNHANAECLCTFIVTPETNPTEPDALRKLLLASTEAMVADSVEGRADPREFKSPHGRGYAVTFTDRKLVGRPPVAGDYKTATVVLLRLAGGITVTATLLSDDAQGPEAAAMIALVRSLGTKPSADHTI
jgi:hypothetical protein